jgi:predicted RNA-binding Zn-ribbon protein involved in translation (DUF1610 family)
VAANTSTNAESWVHCANDAIQKGDMGGAQSAGDVSKIEAGITGFLVHLRSDLVTSGLHLCVQSYGSLFCCPGCGSALCRWGARRRQVTTSEGEGALASARRRCVECGKDYYPFEEANGLSDGHFTTGAKARIAKEAACAAFAEASARLAPQSCGVVVSPKEVGRIVREVAGWRQEEEVAAVAGVYPAMAYGTDNDTDTDTAGGKRLLCCMTGAVGRRRRLR